jgi:hypothetical protein
MSQRDREQAITNVLNDPALANKPDSAIGEHCKVSGTLVGTLRKKLARQHAAKGASSVADNSDGDGDGEVAASAAADGNGTPKEKTKRIVQTRAGYKMDVSNVGGRSTGRKSLVRKAALAKKTLKDSLGQVIPAWAKEVFAAALDVDRYCTALGDVVSGSERLKADVSGVGRLIDPKTVAASVQEIRQHVLDARPWCVCPDCREKRTPRKDCPSCHGQGWMTREEYNAAKLA